MMKRVLSGIVAVIFLAQSTPADAMLPGLFSGAYSNSKVASNYLMSKKKLSACEVNFVKLLNGQVSSDVMQAARTDLWSDQFNERNFLDEMISLKDFSLAQNRIDFLKGLAMLVSRDEVYIKNFTKVINLMKNEGMLSLSDLKRVISSASLTHASITYSRTQRAFIGSLNIDADKARLIELMIKEQVKETDLANQYRHLFRSSSLTHQDLEYAQAYGLSLRSDQESFETLRRYLEFLEPLKESRAKAPRLRLGLKHIEDIYAEHNPKSFDVMSWIRPHQRFMRSSPETMNREAAIRKLVRDSKLSSDMALEYEAAIRQSMLTHEHLEYALEIGVKLRSDMASLERFKEYLVYLDYLPDYRLKKALTHIDKIYAYGDDARFFVPSAALPPHKQFISQRYKIREYRQRRLKAIETEIKLEENQKLATRLDELIEKQRGGEAVVEEINRVRSQIASQEISPVLKARALTRAKTEASIFRKLVNGCNGGGSARLASAKKKFKRFKLALSLGGTPFFYLTRNWDKKDEDPYFWEKLGQEMAISIIFTVVGNRIVTNTNQSFWKRYLSGYLQYTLLDIPTTYSYDFLFGDKAYIRFVQQVYGAGEVPQNLVERELDKLKASPTFDDDIKELLAFLEEHSKMKNTKNLLDELFNLSAYSSLDDEFRITQEDLETEEAREVMLELLAEKLYLANMGDWPIFQTGNRGMDRWGFYRTRAIAWDVKSLALNLAIFELMCREPFGKVGSWGAVLSLVVADWMISGKVTYNWRREAINQ